MATDARTFELRTYLAAPGKLDALLTRFRDHTTALFEKHGMTNIGYWLVTDDDGKPTETVVYLLAHASRQAAKESWAAFESDPEWAAAKAESEGGGGRLTATATSVFLEPTDFSDLR